MHDEPLAIRKRYYDPFLDLGYLRTLSGAEIREYYKGTHDYDNEKSLLPPTEEHPENLISSLCEDGVHRPVLDIDIPAELIPSSTPGKYHLYFPTVELDWPQYLKLLMALAEAGIIETSYLEVSAQNGATHVRPPWVRKVTVDEAMDAAREEHLRRARNNAKRHMENPKNKGKSEALIQVEKLYAEAKNNDVWNEPPLLKEADPELEKLLDEEEAVFSSSKGQWEEVQGTWMYKEPKNPEIFEDDPWK